GIHDDQLVDVAGAAILRVAERAFHHLLQQPGAAVMQELERLQRLVRTLAADQRGERPNLPRGHIRKKVMRSILHRSIKKIRIRIKIRIRTKIKSKIKIMTPTGPSTRV